MTLDLETKNKIRLGVRITLLVQFLAVVATGVVAGLAGVIIPQLGALLTASTTALTTGLGLDYITKPSDPAKEK